MRRLLRYCNLPVLGVLCLVVAAWWGYSWFGGPAPPVPTPEVVTDPVLAGAIRTMARTVRWRRWDRERRMQLGMLYEANALPEFALKCYEQVLRSRDEDPRLWYRIAMSRERLGDDAGAIEAVRRVVELREDFAPAHWRLGIWLLETGESDKAAQSFERALGLDDTNEAPWFGLVRAHLMMREPDTAVRLIHERLLDGPHQSYAYHLLAMAYRQLGRVAEANHAAPRGGQRKPEWTDPWTRQMQRYGTGLASKHKYAERLVLSGQFAPALPLLEDLLGKSPDDAHILNLLGVCYVETGRHQDALEMFQKSLSLKPGGFEAHENLARAYLRIAGGRRAYLERGLAHADRAIGLRSASSVDYRLKASLLYRLGRPLDAVHVLKNGYEVDARDPAPMLLAGKLEGELQLWRDAAGTFKEVVRTHPISFEAHLELALAQMHLGQFDEARTTLAEASRLPGADDERLESARARVEKAALPTAQEPRVLKQGAED